jgi:hypothetical protein
VRRHDKNNVFLLPLLFISLGVYASNEKCFNLEKNVNMNDIDIQKALDRND